MGTVVDFRQRMATGQCEFMLCGRCDQDTAFLPIVSQNKDGRFISELVCIGPQCEGTGTVLEVINGVVST